MSPKIAYIQYTNPAIYPPLEHSSWLLAEDDWNVLFLGIQVVGQANELCLPSHARVSLKQLPSCSPGWRQKLHYAWFTAWVVGWLLYWRPQWIYASDVLSCPVACTLSLLLGSKVIYHEHDFTDEASSSLFMRFCLKTRALLSHQAQLCILPNKQRAKYFSEETGREKNIFCVWNCPTEEEVVPHRLPNDNNELKLLYHGSIVPPRLPPTLLTALAMLPQSVKLRVIGYETVGYQNYVYQLQHLAHHLEISERIEFLGPMLRSEIIEFSRTCDVGLSFMPTATKDINLEWMIGASNKAFDYLACGLALLVSDLPEWNEVYVEPGYGLSCNPSNPESIAAAVSYFLKNPEATREMGELGRQKILSDWNYKRQFEPVREVLREVSCGSKK